MSELSLKQSQFWKFETSADGATAKIRLLGQWKFQLIQMIAHSVQQIPTTPVSEIIIDGSELQSLDTSGALCLLEWEHLKLVGINKAKFTNFNSQQLAILELVRARFAEAPQLKRAESLSFLQIIGKSAIDFYRNAIELVSFIGETVCAVFRLILRPKLFRPRELFAQLEYVCIDAIPIVSLVNLLIGVVVAYLSANQIRQFGANLFIVDGIGIAMCRELSPIIGAIIIAGRSGSAFTAQLGTMKLNEEIDAMRTLSLDPMQVLVLPRIMALMLAMPILIMVGDVLGIIGGLIVAELHLGITPVTFVERLQIVLKAKSVAVGLIKAPVFALFIALIGCRMGLNVENNARSVGLHTTSTVVQSIVCVILLNAGFAVLFQKLGF